MTTPQLPEGLTLVSIDPTSDDPGELARYRELVALRERVDRELMGEYASSFSFDEALANVRKPDTRFSVRAVYDGETMVACGAVAEPLLEDVGTAYLGLDVAPTHRRRGIGSALLAELEATVPDARELSDETSRMPDAEEDPAAEFARAHGYRHHQTTLQSDLRLPLAPDVLERARAEAAEGLAGTSYRIAVVDDTPEERVRADLAQLARVMPVEAPSGERTPEEADYDADRVLADYRAREQSGRRSVLAIAYDGGGTPVGFSDVAIPADPALAFQQDTLVLRAHRGHRLGMALKLAVLDRIVERGLGVERVRTWNDEVNAPMLRVNRSLGSTFGPVLLGWVKNR